MKRWKTELQLVLLLLGRRRVLLHELCQVLDRALAVVLLHHLAGLEDLQGGEAVDLEGNV